MNISSSELNQRIQILEILREEDPDGYSKQEERIVRSSWAKVTRASGSEQLRAGAEVLQERIRFLVRWTHVPLTSKMVVRYRHDDYQIEFINDYEDRHQYVEIWCHRMTQEG